MSDNFPLPLHLLVLDVIGTVLVGVGLFEKFSGSGFVPDAFRFNGYEIALIGIGLLLMAPLVLHVIRLVGGREGRGKEI